MKDVAFLLGADKDEAEKQMLDVLKFEISLGLFPNGFLSN